MGWSAFEPGLRRSPVESIRSRSRLTERCRPGAIGSAGGARRSGVATGRHGSLTTIDGLKSRPRPRKGDRRPLASPPAVPGVVSPSRRPNRTATAIGDLDHPRLVVSRPAPAGDRGARTVVSAVGAATSSASSSETGAAFEHLLGGIRHLAVDKTTTRNRPGVTVSIVAAHGFDDAGAQAAAVSGTRRTHSPPPSPRAENPAAQDVAGEARHRWSTATGWRWAVRAGSTPVPLKAVEDLEARAGLRALTVDARLPGRGDRRPRQLQMACGPLRDQSGQGEHAHRRQLPHRCRALAKLVPGSATTHAELRPEDKARIVAVGLEDVADRDTRSGDRSTTRARPGRGDRGRRGWARPA